VVVNGGTVEVMEVVLMEGHTALRFHQNYLHLCSEDVQWGLNVTRVSN